MNYTLEVWSLCDTRNKSLGEVAHAAVDVEIMMVKRRGSIMLKKGAERSRCVWGHFNLDF